MIIHSPIISGSLTFANGATFTLPTGGVYSGSFSGSYQGASFTGGNFTGNGAGLTFGGTGIVSSSAQVTELLPIDTVSGSSQINVLSTTNIARLATTGSNIFVGDQTITGSLAIKDSETNFLIEGNGFSQTYLTSNGAIVLNPGYGGVEMVGSYRTFKATDITADGFVSGEIRANNGVVSGSSQIVSILSPLNTFSASQESKDSTLATYTGSNDTKWSTLGSLSGSFARTNSDNTFSGLQSFNNINVEGTASFAYIQSTTGSSTSIGEAFIVLNADTPASNFAGIKVIDSGSSFTTASFIYDGLTNNWIFEKANVGSTDTSIAIFGPISTNGLGTELGLTENTLPKAVSSHGHHIGNSNITDTGTLITLGSNTVVSGTLLATGTTLVSGSSQISLGSASGNIALATQTTGDYVASLVAGTGVTLSNNSGENATPTIAIGQSVATSANAQFNSLGIGMAASATAGRIDATNDIVAYSSSDIRFKENITPIENALEKISKISGNTYDWKEENKVDHGYEGNDVGVIAQEIEAVLPQLVQTRESGYKAVKYDKLVALLIEGIKEQQSHIEELTNRINKLENGL